MSQRTLKLAGIAAVALVAATLAWTQQAPRPTSPTQTPGMYTMMNGSGHHSSMYEVMERLQSAITQAIEVKDPAQQTAALHQAQSQVSILQQMTVYPMTEGRGMMMGPGGMHGSMMNSHHPAMPMNGMSREGNLPATR